MIALSGLRNFFGRNEFARGSSYAHGGHVLSVEKVASRQIKSKVKGSGSSTYKQDIIINDNDIEGFCSCPVGFNCKHVVAALIKFQESHSNSEKPISDRPSISVPPQELTPHIESLLKEIASISRKSSPIEEKGVSRKKLFYILQHEKTYTESLSIQLRTADLAKDGSVTGSRDSNYNAATFNNLPKFFTLEDTEVFSLINTVQSGGYNRISLRGEYGVLLLEKILKTGRLHWQTENSPALKQGGIKQGELTWKILEQGQQKMVLSVKDNQQDDVAQSLTILPITPAWYMNRDRHEIGKVETQFSPVIQEKFLSLPPLNPQLTQIAIEKLEKLAPSLSLPVPPKVETIKKTGIIPTPHLYLFSKTKQSMYHLYGAPKSNQECYARLSFDYDGMKTPSDKYSETLIKVVGNKVTEIQRSKKKEDFAARKILECGMVHDNDFHSVPWGENRPYNDFIYNSYTEVDSYPAEWINFILDTIHLLREEGWVIEISPDFPIKAQTLESDIHISLNEGAGIDWFNLGVSTELAKTREEINLLPILINTIRGMNLASFNGFIDSPDDSRYTIKMDNGSYLSIELGRIRNILTFLKELWQSGKISNGGNDQLNLSRSDLILMAATEAASESARLRWFGQEEFRETLKKLKDFKEITPVLPPKTLHAELRPYQQTGLNWLSFLSDYNFGGILADDMGLGKTIQTLAWILREKEEGRLSKPALIIAPTSLVHNWHQEASKFSPTLKVLPLQGKDRKKHFDTINDHDIVITTYPLLPHDQDILKQQDYHAVILDEAQFIKNTKALMTQIVHQLSAKHRLCLTGTPLENHLGELWSLFHFLQPGYLGDEKTFNAAFRRPIEKQNDNDRKELLRRRIRPFLLRRLKAEVALELPPKTEIIRTVEMDKNQSDLYETIRLSMHEKIKEEIAKKGLARSHIIVLDALLKLRQVCCDPRLLKLETAKKSKARSAKLDMLMDMLPSLIEEGRKIILFSQFTEMLDLIIEACNKGKIPFVTLTGQTTDRKNPVSKFQKGDVPLFLISLKAGGTGLNLTSADTVIHYDPWWNPAVENQATDRAHRIGQDKPIFVYKFITAGTIEEKIMDMQKKKQSLSDAIFDNASETVKGKLDENDISVLFSKI